MNARRIVLAVDHGTSGVKASLVTTQGKVLCSDAEKTSLVILPGGGVEQDPDQWWGALVKVCRRLLQKGGVRPAEIVALCVSSTFSTTVALGSSGRHLMNAVTWMDSRGAPYVRRLMGGFPSIMGYSLAKAMKWISKTSGAPSMSGKDDIGHVLLIKNEFPTIYEKTRVFLPSKDYLNYRITGEICASYDSMHLFWLTDVRDLSRIRYDDELVRLSGIDKTKLPPMVPSTQLVGNVCRSAAEELGLDTSVKVVAGSPDHQCACIGSGAVEDFTAHLYVGTSSWLQCLVPFKKTDMFHSIASFPTAVPTRYQSVNEQDMAGGALDFLARIAGQCMGSAEAVSEGKFSYAAFEEAASRVPPGSNGVMVTPWLNGERTPVDDPALRAGIHNLSLSSTFSDIARALYEGVALNTRWSMKYVERFVGRRLDPIRIVGGAATSDLWCRIFADCLQRTIIRPVDPIRANARGAAFIAAVGLGDITFADIPSLMEYDRTFEPDASLGGVYDCLFDAFVELYRKNRSWFGRMNTTERSAPQKA